MTTRQFERMLDDEAQVAALARYRHAAAQRDIARRSRLLRIAAAVTAIGVAVLAVAVLVLLVIAWAATGDDRIGWAYWLVVACIVGAYVLLASNDDGGAA